ncbi:hypothetical protein KL86SPO_50643 [uncultured Sporomusa sp.]|uniref:Uncharacterized protein n=1 Tax=uncultured Sporomusa sp. TaxID=307249 RepID=A0A212LZB8_9FIRM|nr:hypothetical protein KL86SPO_50643 [uncultured Sporomusa sp.]
MKVSPTVYIIATYFRQQRYQLSLQAVMPQKYSCWYNYN